MSQTPPPIQFPPQDSKRGVNPGLIVAIVLLAGACLVIPVFAAILLPVFSSAKTAAKSTACLTNVKQLTLGQLMYAADYNDVLPPAREWCDLTAPFTKNPDLHECPELKAPFSYAMDSRMSRARLVKLADASRSVLVFEPGSMGKNKFGKVESDQATPGRHSGRNALGFADGHAKLQAP